MPLMKFGYLGIFLISFIGAGSILFPIPYTIVTLAAAPLFNPILLALATSLGAAAGEFTSYMVGYLSRKAVSKKYERRLNTLHKIFKKFGVVAIFIFALTPLPDDLIFIPLGLLRYSIRKALVAAFIGKFCMCLILVYVGKAIWWTFAIDWHFTILTAILLIIFIVAMFKINWEKIVEKYIGDG